MNEDRVEISSIPGLKVFREALCQDSPAEMISHPKASYGIYKRVDPPESGVLNLDNIAGYSTGEGKPIYAVVKNTQGRNQVYEIFIEEEEPLSDPDVYIRTIDDSGRDTVLIGKKFPTSKEWFCENEISGVQSIYIAGENSLARKLEYKEGDEFNSIALRKGDQVLISDKGAQRLN